MGISRKPQYLSSNISSPNSGLNIPPINTGYDCRVSPRLTFLGIAESIRSGKNNSEIIDFDDLVKNSVASGI
jgi:hypothetical protein